MEEELSSEESVAGEFIVEKIVAHHGNPNKPSTLRFQTRWEGWDSKNDTWEPYKNVSDCIAFEEYLQDNPPLKAALCNKKLKREPEPSPPQKAKSKNKEMYDVVLLTLVYYSYCVLKLWPMFIFSGSEAADGNPFPMVTTVEKDIIFEQAKKLYFKEAVSIDFLEALLQEYLRYIYIKISKRHVSFQPCEDVDKFWHAHIICTRQYHEFCNRCNNGVYIHHSPDRNNNASAYRNTLKEYTAFFGTEPTPQFWGEGKSSSSSTIKAESESLNAKSGSSTIKKDGVYVVKIPVVDISLEDLDKVVQPNIGGCTKSEVIAICETNAMQKLSILFDIKEIKYREEENGLYKYVGDQATSGPGCSSNAIFFCKKCRHVWEFGFCDRDSTCLKCDTQSYTAETPTTTPTGRADSTTVDYVVRCFGCA